jgi:hypothetical protein
LGKFHKAQRTSSSDHSQRATHLNQFQETLGTRKNHFPEKRSAVKNQLFFFLFDVFDFSRNSGRLTDFYYQFFHEIQINAINSKTGQKKAEKAEKACPTHVSVN